MIAPVLFVCALLGLVSAAPGTLPEELPRCRRSDPKFDECLVKAIQSSMPTLIKGIPKLGLYPVDPLEITSLHIDQGGSQGSVALDLKFTNLFIKGLKNYVTTRVKSDLDNYKLEVEGYIPGPFQLDGDYEMKGKVLIVPLQGKGKSNLTLDDVKATISLVGKESIKNGLKYFQLENLVVDYETKKLTTNFENLFSQDKTVGENLQTFINENWEEIHKELHPAIKEALGAAFKEIASRIFSKVPLDDIFLP